jgi:hypothetical protein
MIAKEGGARTDWILVGAGLSRTPNKRLGPGMEHGMEASYIRLEGIL